MRSFKRLQTTNRRLAKRLAHPRSHRLLREAAFLVAGRITPKFAFEADGATYFLDTKDMTLSRLMYLHGNRDGEDLGLALRVLAAETSRSATLRGQDFIDVGANIGTTTIPALTQFEAQRALAFEPSHENLTNLRHATIANGVEDRCLTHELAISDRAGEVRLALSERNPADHRVVLDGAISERKEIVVRSETLDALVANGTLDPDRIGLLWIDVQGHEAHVLAGARQLLEAQVPIHVEFFPSGLHEAGGFRRLCELLPEHYSRMVDLHPLRPPGSRPTQHTTDELPRLAEKLRGEQFTNLILLP